MLNGSRRSAIVLAVAFWTAPSACAGQGRPPTENAPATEAQAPPAGAGAAAGETAQLIVLGGGATQEEGESWMKRWIKARYFHGELFRPGPGYPKLVRSDDVPGLEPGFHVVLLGICSAKEAPARLEFVRSVFPGTYVRPVAAAAEACPAMPFRTALAASRTIPKERSRIVVNLYFSPQEERLDPEAWKQARAAGLRGPGTYKVMAASFDGDLLYHYAGDKSFPAERDPATGITTICKLALSGAADRIVLDAACDEDDPPACTGRTTHFVARTTYRFDGRAVDEKTDVIEKRVSKLCD